MTFSALGQNFSKMFDISVEDPDKKLDKIFVWQNSWYEFAPSRTKVKSFMTIYFGVWINCLPSLIC